MAMIYLRKYHDETQWETVTKDQLFECFLGYYSNPTLIIKELETLRTIVTPLATYKVAFEISPKQGD